MKLRIRNLSVSIHGASLLKSIHLTLERGEKIAIIGLNGAGKTTLLKSIAGLLPYSGTIEIDGIDARDLSLREKARYLSYSPQKQESLGDLSVFEFVLMGVTPHLSFLEHPGKEHHQKVEEALTFCGITPFRNRPVMTMSGGEQQMVFLARAFLQKTPFLLFDEPFSHLDFRAAYAAAEKVTNFVKETAVGAAITVHDPNIALAFADKIVILHEQSVLTKINAKKANFLNFYEKALNVIYDNGVQMLFWDDRPIIATK